MTREYFNPHKIKYSDFVKIKHHGSGYYFTGSDWQRGYGNRYFVTQGKGLGNILGFVTRILIKLAKAAGKSVAKNAGKEALNTGGRILDNITQGVNFKQAVKEQAKEGVNRFLNRYGQSGGSLKTKRDANNPKRKLIYKQKNKPKHKKPKITKNLSGHINGKSITLKGSKNNFGLF